MKNIKPEDVRRALKMMGYSEDEIDEKTKDEIKMIMELVSNMDEIMKVNIEEECPVLPDE